MRLHSKWDARDHQIGLLHLRENSFLPPTRFPIFLLPEMQYQQTPSLQLNYFAPGAEEITCGKTIGRGGRGMATLEAMWKNIRKKYWVKILPESISLHSVCFSAFSFMRRSLRLVFPLGPSGITCLSPWDLCQAGQCKHSLTEVSSSFKQPC